MRTKPPPTHPRKPSRTSRDGRERRDPRESKTRTTPEASDIESPPAPEEITVSGLSDQNRSKWIHVSRGSKSAIARESSLDDHGSSIWRELADQGLRFTRVQSKQAILNCIEDIREWPESVYVATRPGYHRSAFVRPDGKVIGKPQAEHFRVVLRGPPITISRRGSLKSWKAVVRQFAQGQVTYTTLACAAFVGPILELFPQADNVCLWFAGDTSGGKTTGLDFFCSVWGAPHQQAGSLGISLKSTPVGLEQHMMARNATIFAADDVNHLGRNSREQGERVYDLTFMVSHGVEKERCNDPARPRVQQCFLATSNTSLRSLLEAQDEANADAVLARFLTLPSEAGDFGVFDTIPPGCADAGAAVDGLKQALVENHGCAANAFLSRWVKARRIDEAALKAKLEKHRDRFLRWVSVDPHDRAGNRRARSYAMIYAAGRLAKEWRILPLKGLSALLREAYRRSAAVDAEGAPRPSLSPQQRVQAYVEANLSTLRDLDSRKPSRMSTERLDGCSGFLKTAKQRRSLLIRKQRWDREFGGEAHRLLKQLQANGCLYTSDKLQAQIKVRANSGKDRVYCIALL